MHDSVFDVGDTLGDYELVSHLTQGGMAALFLGRRKDAAPGDPPVAIKVIHESLSDDWQFVRMFIDEALISVRIRHPNVIRVEELGEANETYYLVMEYVHGCSLAELLRALAKQGRRMRPEIAMWIAAQVAAGLHAAHEMTGEDGRLLNVVHRDVSPQNVLLSSDGEVKLLDFGIAKAAGRAERTQAGVIKGKVRYMAPEQAKGGNLDRRVDIYALAIVLWEMLTMRRFIEGRSEIEIIRKVRNPSPVPPSERGKGISKAIDEAVLAGLVVDPEARPATAAQFGQHLEAAVPDASVGPAHVAELLRVFVGEHLEKTARALPPSIGGVLLRATTDVSALPGEDPDTLDQTSDLDRTRTLTLELPAAPGPTSEALTKSLRRPANRPPPSPRAAPAPLPPPATPAPLSGAEVLPSFADVEDDERTMEASGEELKQFLNRIRQDAASPTPATRPGIPAEPSVQINPIDPSATSPTTPAFSQPPIPFPEEPVTNILSKTRAPRTDEAPPHKKVGAAGWVLRVALITVVAFVLGAGLAVAVVKLLL